MSLTNKKMFLKVFLKRMIHTNLKLVALLIYKILHDTLQVHKNVYDQKMLLRRLCGFF